jgi:hypothetical protein
LAAAKVANPNKDALADLAGSVLASLRNHKGKAIERTSGSRQRGGGLLAKTEFNGIGAIAKLHRSCADMRHSSRTFGPSSHGWGLSFLDL